MKEKITTHIKNEFVIEDKLLEPLSGTKFCYKCRTFGAYNTCETCSQMTHDAIYEQYAEKIREMVVRRQWTGECVCSYGALCSDCGDYFCSRNNGYNQRCSECCNRPIRRKEY